MTKRERMLLDRATYLTKYEAKFWSEAQTVMEKCKLKGLAEYADMKYREKMAASITLVQLALTIRQNANSEESA